MSSETKQLERNVSRNLQTTAADWGRVFEGDWNNLGPTLLRTATIGATGGYSLLANPDDLRQVTGETGSERFVREEGEKAEAQVQADIAAREDERKQKVINRIAAEIEQRRLTPGTSLLTVSSLSQRNSGNTILTSRG